jgi:glycosyltransferase involved in cell wall biosynthesis
LFLRSLINIPWVAEFRDPWNPPQRRWRPKFERWLQRLLLRKSDAVVVHSKGYAQELVDSYSVPRSKIALVSNGFDEDDFDADRWPQKEMLEPGYIHVSHFGTVYPSRSGKFFQALMELARECPGVKERLRVNIIGFPDSEVEEYAKREELREVIKVYNFMQHEDSLQAMRSSHGLLLFWGDPAYSRLTVAGKLYEYLRVGRPILALDHGGETRELISAAQAGWAVPPDDIQGIKQALRTILQDSPRFLPPAAPPEFVAQFRYDRLAKRLAEVFNGVCE